MIWKVNFDFYMKYLIEGTYINDTCFFFDDDISETEHYIGCVLEHSKVYWSGYCDIPDGTDYKTAEELINAPIQNGKSLKERWNEVRICSIDYLSFEDWYRYILNQQK